MFSTRLLTVLALAASLPFSMSVNPVTLDSWAPRVLYPHDGTVWYAGDYHNVTWDTSTAPDSITNPHGEIYLVNDDRILFEHELASGFSLLDGRVEVQVPDVATGNSYQLVLIGNSGDDSERFTIINQ